MLFKFWCHFFFFYTPFFDCRPVFRGDIQPIEKNLLDFQMQNFMLNLLNKNLFKNNHYSRCLQDPENSWCVLVKFEIFEQILGTKEDSQIKKRFEDSICFTFHLSTYYYMYPTCKNSTKKKKKCMPAKLLLVDSVGNFIIYTTIVWNDTPLSWSVSNFKSWR